MILIFSPKDERLLSHRASGDENFKMYYDRIIAPEKKIEKKIYAYFQKLIHWKSNPYGDTLKNDPP